MMENSENSSKKQQKKKKLQLVQWRTSLISVATLLLLLILFTLFLLVFPRSHTSNIEKRELATFPAFSFQSYFSGEFTAGIATYYDDTVPFRDSFKNMSNNLKSLFGFPTKNAAVIIGNPVKTDQNSPDSEEDDVSGVSPASSEEPDQKDYRGEKAQGAINSENGILIVNQDGHWRGLELFGGGTGNTYRKALNNLRKKLDSKIKIYSMPAPLASEFYTPSNFSEYSASQEECFAKIAGKLDKGITSVDAISALRKHTEEDIYCRTDHHWQPLGAYYAAQAFAQAAGVPFAEIGSYKATEIKDFVGTLYAFSSDSKLLNDPDTFTFYEPKDKITVSYYDQSFQFVNEGELIAPDYGDTSAAYSRIINGDTYVTKITTGVNNKRKLLVVKDSYGNAEIPFYTGSFSEIYVVDMRYFERNLVNFIKKMDVTDVLFSMAAFSVVGENAENLDNLFTQDAKSKIVDEHPVKVSASSKTTSSGSDASGAGETASGN